MFYKFLDSYSQINGSCDLAFRREHQSGNDRKILKRDSLDPHLLHTAREMLENVHRTVSPNIHFEN